MIPTPAKRRVHQSMMEQHQHDEESINDLKENEPEQVTLINSLMSAKQAELLMSSAAAEAERDQEMYDEEEIIDDDEDLEYMRLDTIVEEDENCCSADDELLQQQQQQHMIDKISRVDCQDTTSIMSLCDKRRRQFYLSSTASADASTTDSCETHDERPQAAAIAHHILDAEANYETSSGDFDDHQKSSSSNNNNNKNNNNNNDDKSQPTSDNNVPTPTTIDRLGSRLAFATTNKMEQQQQQQRKTSSIVVSSQPLPLPSTNRLISEHQARQKQALFRCLAERQKMLDESGQRPLDLMSAASLKCLAQQRQQCSSGASVKSTSSSGRGTASRKRHSSGAAQHGGVPLSAVDLNSISDVQIDEMLGRLASASSSSLSSNGESLDSSDLSNVNSEDDESTTGPEDLTSGGSDDLSSSDGSESARTGAGHRKRRNKHRSKKAAAVAMDAPNVIGVHEDAPTSISQRNGRNQVNCRDSHRLARPGNRSTDHDDDDHELLSVRPNQGQFTGSSSLSPLPGHQQQQQKHSSLPQEDSNLERSKLEQYFTSNLVNPHEFSSEDSVATRPSVEEVLMRMLQVLNDIGPNEQERVTELIERDFVQLEQLLLNNSLQTTNNHLQQKSSSSSHPLNNRSQQPPGNLAQKLISCQQQLTGGTGASMCKDSDYGSDTQSADCFSQCNEQTNTSNKWLSRQSTSASDQLQVLANLSDSPSPTSLATTASSSGVSTSTTNNQAPGKQQPILSPLAIELSFKLAESLQRLAQQRRGSNQLMQDSTDDDDDAEAEAEADEPDTVQLVSGPNNNLDEDFGGTPASNNVDLELSQVDHSKNDAIHPQANKAKRSPMKSIVLINANRSQSATSIVSKAPPTATTTVSDSSPVAGQAPLEARNLTPVNGLEVIGGVTMAVDLSNRQASRSSESSTNPSDAADKVAPLSSNGGGNGNKPLTSRQPFKTRVNINSSSTTVSTATSSASSVIVADANVHDDQTKASEKLSVPARSSYSSEKLQDNTKQEAAAIEIEAEAKQEEKEEEAADLKVLGKLNSDEQESGSQVQSAESATVNQFAFAAPAQDLLAAATATSGKQQVQPGSSSFVRRRSARSSLRRRPSFTGSINSLSADQQQPTLRQPRPGSPLPRPLLSQVAEQELEMMQRELSHSSTAANQQHQLQKALVLAQKYNYSPAKLAASKLSHKLLLSNGNESSSMQGTYLHRIIKRYLSEYDAPTGIYASANGSHALNKDQKPAKSELPAGKTPSSSSSTSDKRRSIVVTGQVQLDIYYEAKSGSLTVHLMRCAQLAPVSKRRTTSNPYVKLYLLPDRSKSGKRKSHIRRNELNPEFNEDFTFGPIQLADFDRRLLWLSIWHKDRLGRNEFLGELHLPMSQVRSQLLTSDSCQSTTPKWYHLSDRRQDLDTLDRKAGRSSSKSHISHNAKEQQVADKLGELQRKAARLSTAMASSSPSGAAVFPTQMNCTLGPLSSSISATDELDGVALPPAITGKLFVALKFVPENQDMGLATISTKTQQNMAGELQVMIKEARNIGGFDMGPIHQQTSCLESNSTANSATNSIRAPPAGALPNPYCKCYLLSTSGQRLAKQKTPTMKRTANPRWDHKCVFPSLKLGQLTSQAIEIHMFNRDQSILVSSSSNEYLGAVRLCKGANHLSTGDSMQQDSESIASDQSISEHSERLSRQNSNASHSGTSQTTMSRRSITTIEQQQLKEPEGSLCTERESRLWSQVLQRPGIWVYGELRLRHLRPLIVLDDSAKHHSSLSNSGSSRSAQATKAVNVNGSYKPSASVSAPVY